MDSNAGHAPHSQVSAAPGTCRAAPAFSTRRPDTARSRNEDVVYSAIYEPFDRDEFVPDPRAARAYQEINKGYTALTAFTDPLFRSMADRLHGLERAPGPGRR
jgi:hypothetical protein